MKHLTAEQAREKETGAHWAGHFLFAFIILGNYKICFYNSFIIAGSCKRGNKRKKALNFPLKQPLVHWLAGSIQSFEWMNGSPNAFSTTRLLSPYDLVTAVSFCLSCPYLRVFALADFTKNLSLIFPQVSTRSSCCKESFPGYFLQRNPTL